MSFDYQEQQRKILRILERQKKQEQIDYEQAQKELEEWHKEKTADLDAFHKKQEEEMAEFELAKEEADLAWEKKLLEEKEELAEIEANEEFYS